MTDSFTPGLYVVSTPIGNLGDINPRAITILSEADLVVCEDTRRTATLFDKLGIHVLKSKLYSFYDEVEADKAPLLIDRLRSELRIALVSDAGTPTIADPGFKLVRECRRQGIPVYAVPGPCAAIAALSVSGLPTDRFLFLGYLPKKAGQAETLLNSIRIGLESLPATVIFYESPFRVGSTLNLLAKVFGDIEMVILAELTKRYERYEVGKISEIGRKYETSQKGEFVLLFNLKHPVAV